MTTTKANAGNAQMPSNNSPARMSDRDIALWENDVSNLMGDETFRQQVREGLFGHLQRQGLTPEQAYPYEQGAKQREEYARWLELQGR